VSQDRRHCTVVPFRRRSLDPQLPHQDHMLPGADLSLTARGPNELVDVDVVQQVVMPVVRSVSTATATHMADDMWAVPVNLPFTAFRRSLRSSARARRLLSGITMREDEPSAGSAPPHGRGRQRGGGRRRGRRRHARASAPLLRRGFGAADWWWWCWERWRRKGRVLQCYCCYRGWRTDSLYRRDGGGFLVHREKRVVYTHVIKKDGGYTHTTKKFADTCMPCTELSFTRVPFH
jgi:hypothetical protein